MQFRRMPSVSKLETRNSKLIFEDAAPRKVILLAWRQQGCTTYYTETLKNFTTKNTKVFTKVLPATLVSFVVRFCPLAAFVRDCI
jgi:hypothetical protein